MNDHDHLEQRLTEHAARWRANLPEPGSVDPAAFTRGGVVRRIVPAVAAAAAVAALAVGAAVLFSGDPDGVTSPADTPATEPTDEPTSSAPVRCGPGDLAADSPRWEGTAGTGFLIFDLVLTDADRPCTVGGYPVVTMLDHGVDARVPVENVRPEEVTDVLLVERDQPVQVALGWASNHYCGEIDNDRIRVTVGEGATMEVDGFGQTHCEPGEGQPPVQLFPLGHLPTVQGPPEKTPVDPGTGASFDACGAGDLEVTGRALEPAAGTAYLTVDLALAGDEPCTVSGYPQVTIVDHGSDAFVEITQVDQDRVSELVVEDRPVQVTLAWAYTHTCDDIDNDRIRLATTGGVEVEIEGFGQTSCAPGEGNQPVRVSPFVFP